MSEPHWERGYRVHGYWLGMIRLGWVGLPQGRNVARDGYGWSFDPPGCKSIDGWAKTLRKAKKAVEDEYRKMEDKDRWPSGV